jgi:hypothetical protein
VSRAEARTRPAPDDWEAHWSSFAEATERNPAQAFRRRLVLGRGSLPTAPERYLDIGSSQGDLGQPLWRTLGAGR